MRDLPMVDVVHAVETGIRIWRPAFKTLKVAHLATGNTVLTYHESGRDPVLFELTPTQRDQFVALLAHPTSPAPVAFDTAQVVS